ncbi:MAG: TIGR03668 family PPOX class F420-dependent oxidoreductase [Actinomycetota bacterium]
MPADTELVRRRFGEARVARLATITEDGSPHLVPCTFVLDGELVHTAVDAKPKSTLALKRLDNIRAHPSVTFLVDHYDEDWDALWWVRADGTARIVEDGPDRDRALTLLVEKYSQYREVALPGAVITVTIDRWRSWR